MRIDTNMNSVIDPQYAQEHATYVKEFSIDSLSLKSIILASLGKLYGLIGESIPLDILEILKKNPTKLIIRTQIEDKEKLINSLLAFTFNMGKFGGDLDVSCYIKVVKTSLSLG